MFAALSFWAWTRDGNNTASAVLFGSVFFCGFLSHPYMVLCLVPYAVWDLWQRRRLSSKVIAGAVGIGCAAATLAIHIVGAMGNAKNFPGHRPSLSALLAVIPQMFPAGLLLLALVTAWIVLASRSGLRRQLTPRLPMQPAERAGWLFLLIPLAGYLLARVVTNAFDPRYFIGMLPGVAVAFACFIWRRFGKSRVPAAGILALLVAAGLAKQANALRHPGSRFEPQIRQMLGLEETLRQDGKHFFLFSGNFLYREAQYYSKHPEEYVLLDSIDPIFRTPKTFADYYSLRSWTLKDVEQHARETALISSGPGIMNAMEQAGFTAHTRFTDPIEVVYFQ
jgi:hypothetical protein